MAVQQEPIVLESGQSLSFLDYTICNTNKSDGLVLFKRPGKDYETHLGNYGPGDQRSIDNAKQAAILHFLIARPDDFSATLLYRLMGDGGQYLEYSKFASVCKREGIAIPDEITPSHEGNTQIYFKGKKIAWLR